MRVGEEERDNFIVLIYILIILLSKMNCDNNNLQTTQSIADYLAQLLKDRKQLAAFPTVFNHVERLLDEG